MRYPLTNRLAAEAFATFALVFAGCGAIVVNDTLADGAIGHVGVSLTFGLVVMAMIYAVGEVSGAHLNPAVTLGFFLARRMPALEVGPYIAAQCLGAVAAAGALAVMVPGHPDLGATLPAGGWPQAFAMEIVLTAFLMFVILSVALGSKEVGLMAGIAIGGTVALDALFGGPVSGASMNPARSLGPALVSGELADLWIYLTATVVGAAVAVPCWALVHRRRCPQPHPQPPTPANGSESS